MASSKVYAVTLLAAVALAGHFCSASAAKAPKPDYCKQTFQVVAAAVQDSFINIVGTGVLQRGSSFSFGIGLFLPPYYNQTIGNVYGQANVIDLNAYDPYSRPDGYIYSFANFNFISPVGQLAAQGIWTEKLNATSSFPVVGGTGVYATAAGTADMIVVAKQTYLFTIKLAKDSC